MKWRRGLRAALGVVLCVAGFVLARATPYRETTAVIGAGGCRLVTDVIDQGNDDARGFVAQRLQQPQHAVIGRLEVSGRAHQK